MNMLLVVNCLRNIFIKHVQLKCLNLCQFLYVPGCISFVTGKVNCVKWKPLKKVIWRRKAATDTHIVYSVHTCTQHTKTQKANGTIHEICEGVCSGKNKHVLSKDTLSINPSCLFGKKKVNIVFADQVLDGIWNHSPHSLNETRALSTKLHHWIAWI